MLNASCITLDSDVQFDLLCGQQFLRIVKSLKRLEIKCKINDNFTVGSRYIIFGNSLQIAILRHYSLFSSYRNLVFDLVADILFLSEELRGYL